jgi:hypothetical protein
MLVKMQEDLNVVSIGEKKENREEIQGKHMAEALPRMSNSIHYQTA